MTTKITPNDRAKEVGKLNQANNKLASTTIAERIKIYTTALANGSNKRDAYAAAGYGCPTFSNAHNFHEKYHKEIDKELRNVIHSKVPTALQVLEEVMVSGKSETARVKAALEILDRAGFDKQTKIQIGSSEAKSEDQLKQELQQLLTANPDVLLIDSD